MSIIMLSMLVVSFFIAWQARKRGEVVLAMLGSFAAGGCWIAWMVTL